MRCSNPTRRRQHEAVDESEHRGVHADRQRECHHDADGEGWFAPQRPYCLSQVATNAVYLCHCSCLRRCAPPVEAPRIEHCVERIGCPIIVTPPQSSSRAYGLDLLVFVPEGWDGCADSWDSSQPGQTRTALVSEG